MSPLRNLIPDYIAPERLYLEARWASLAPYAAAAGLLADILPIASGANAKTLREHTRVAERAEAELAEERPCFIDGCPAEWARLPIPDSRIVVGLDGGYVRNWEDRKTNFEVIVGQSVPEDRYVGLVHGYDRKLKRRLFDVLKSQGPATQSGRHVPDRRWRGDPGADRVDHPGVQAHPRLVSHRHACDRACTVCAWCCPS